MGSHIPLQLLFSLRFGIRDHGKSTSFQWLLFKATTKLELNQNLAILLPGKGWLLFKFWAFLWKPSCAVFPQLLGCRSQTHIWKSIPSDLFNVSVTIWIGWASINSWSRGFSPLKEVPLVGFVWIVLGGSRTLFVNGVILICLADQATMADMFRMLLHCPFVWKELKALQRQKAGGVGIVEECDKCLVWATHC